MWARRMRCLPEPAGPVVQSGVSIMLISSDAESAVRMQTRNERWHKVSWPVPRGTDWCYNSLKLRRAGRSQPKGDPQMYWVLKAFKIWNRQSGQEIYLRNQYYIWLSQVEVPRELSWSLLIPECGC